VEDAELMIRALRKAGFANRLQHLEDGVQALDYLLGTGPQPRPAADLPRLVILDLKLPRMSGLDLLRRLRAEPTTRALPVVVMTSSREDHDLQQAYDLGANSYVVKPVDFGQFVEAMQKLGYYWLLINEVPYRSR
jgi:two-component system response regulator